MAPSLSTTPFPGCLPGSIDERGWLQSVRRCDSPNFNARPPGASVSLLVVHNISLPPEQFGGGFIEQFFCNRLDSTAHPYFTQICALQVSAHCLIDRQGAITQFVAFDDRAWHAGQSVFEGRENCNDFSVGVELEGADHIAYTSQQYQALAHITRLLLARYPDLHPQRIVGHSSIAPGRKTDPGPAFDWAYFLSLLGAQPCT